MDIKNVIQTIDVKTIYEAPISFNRENLDGQVLKYFNIKSKKSVNLKPWKKITNIVLKNKKYVNIGIIGKYVNLKDAYKSLDEALVHGGISNNTKVNLIRIESDNFKKSDVRKKLQNVSGILIPGGFGKEAQMVKLLLLNTQEKKKFLF